MKWQPLCFGLNSFGRVLSSLCLLSVVGSLASAEKMNLGDFVYTPGFTSTNFNSVIDLTAVDVSISYLVDLDAVTKSTAALGPYVEVGLREVGAANFNPGTFGTHPGDKGGWMISAVGDLQTDPSGFDVDDKHNLQSAGDLDETKYDAIDRGTVTNSFGTLTNTKGIYFDRDGVAAGEDASHANTLGLYAITVDFHAVAPNLATMFATVNGLSQGFLPGVSGSVDPAGVSFSGDMSQMQVFLGAIMDNGTGIIEVRDLTVTTTPVPEPAGAMMVILAMITIGIARRP